MKTEFKLIDGVFTPEEANEILTQLISTKITHHNLRVLNNNNNNSDVKISSERRISELKELKRNLKELILQNDKSQLKVLFN